MAQIKHHSIRKEQHKNLFDVISKTINQTALVVSLVCQKDQAHETCCEAESELQSAN